MGDGDDGTDAGGGALAATEAAGSSSDTSLGVSDDGLVTVSSGVRELSLTGELGAELLRALPLPMPALLLVPSLLSCSLRRCWL